MVWVAPAWAQFTVEGVPVQAHGFFSQGFLYSQGNNYMTMPTNNGSFAFTDGGLNLSAQVNDKLRVGAQLYDRNIGNLGNGHVTLDWASFDYRFNDAFGIRAGKVKTVFGLYTDTQDLGFLHTWAMLPQSIYPLDLRGITIAHTGGDIYGSFSPKLAGTFSYTAYVGTAPNDVSGGYSYGLAALGQRVNRTAGTIKGADLKWNTPVEGLLVGTGYLLEPDHFDCTNAYTGGPGRIELGRRSWILSAQYMRGSWRLDAEYSRQKEDVVLTGVGASVLSLRAQFPLDQRAWYVSAAYRFSKHLEAGGYYSEFLPNDDFIRPLWNLPDSTRHIYDPAVTLRVDFKEHWDLKIEGHHIDGGGDPTAFRGIYPQDDASGLKPRTNLLVVRLGFNI